MRDWDDASRSRTALSRGLNGFMRWEQCLATPSPMNTRRCPHHGDIGKGKQGHAGEMLAGCLEIAPSSPTMANKTQQVSALEARRPT
ncbi:hypothetical protein CapIbe_019055 [Capra ibex]